MPYYETVYIARQELSETQVKALTEIFSQFLKDGKGKVLKVENWGLRTLAYRINKNRKGHYVMIESDASPEALLEMERNMRLSEDVLRYMSLKLEEPSKAPSVMMNKNDRDTDDATTKDKKEAA